VRHARAMTRLPGYHFFGYYGIQPWDVSEDRLLCLEVPFQDRPPGATDRATIVLVDCDTRKILSVAQTLAWNFQQGCMLHWLPRQSEIIYNDRIGDRFASVVLNVETRERRTLSRPISALSHDGRFGLSLNFARLHAKRPGYGYAGVPDPHAGQKHPSEDGVYALDLESGEVWLVVSLHDVFEMRGRGEEVRNAELWFNHTLFNTDGSRFVFLSRFAVGTGRKSAMFTSDLEGSDLRCLIDYGLISHFDWLDPETILAWANIKGLGDAFYLVRDGGNDIRKVGEGILTQDGHCSFSPDGRWILTDTYPGRDQARELMLFEWKKGNLHSLGKFHSDPALSGEIRCDLHPRWSRRGSRICFDSTHEGSRQLYVMDLQGI